MPSGAYRILLVIKKNWTVIFVVFLILGLFFYHMYSAIPTEYIHTGTKTVKLYTWEGDLWGRGIVTEENPIWAKGEEVSLPIYPMSISKEADIGLSFRVIGNDPNLTFNREVKVIYYISYDKKRIINETYSTSRNVSSGAGFSDSLIVNISDISKRIDGISSYLKLPRQESGIDIIGVVSYSGTVGGKKVSGTQTFKGSIEIQYGGFYTINGESKNKTVTTTQKYTTVKRLRSKKRTAYFSISILSAVVALVALGIGVGFRPDENTIRKIELESEASKFSKWISRGKLEDFTSSAKVRMSSLSDLVNAAIDMNERVIYDGNERVYFVLHNGILYYFEASTDKETEEHSKKSKVSSENAKENLN